MPLRFRLPIAVLLAALTTGPALAYHEESEPSDGTVRSFIAVDPPVSVGDLDFVDGAGRKRRLSDFRGRVILLNLWATWCPPCVRELPALDRLQTRVGSTDFEVLTLSIDEGGIEASRPFFEKLGIRRLPLLAAPASEVGRLFPVDVLPASFMLDRAGRVTHYLRSYVDWDAPEADAFVRGLSRGDLQAPFKRNAH